MADQSYSHEDKEAMGSRRSDSTTERHRRDRRGKNRTDKRGDETTLDSTSVSLVNCNELTSHELKIQRLSYFQAFSLALSCRPAIRSEWPTRRVASLILILPVLLLSH